MQNKINYDKGIKTDKYSRLSEENIKLRVLKDKDFRDSLNLVTANERKRIQNSLRIIKNKINEITNRA